jgi:signal transduction histidine kinase
MVVANAITALSYLTICFTLFYLVRHTRRVLARDWAYFAVGFALFIVACGSTHIMEVVTTWQPWFWVDAAANIITAMLSAWVAIALIGRVSILGDGINDYASRLANTEVEQRQMRESLMAAQKLEDWSKMSTVFAHEIANPLETIQNLLYLIQNTEGVQPEIVALAASAGEEADRVLGISRTTLGFFRQGAEAETLDLYAAAESVRFLLHNRLEKHGVTLQLLSTGDTTVQALPGECRQVLLNLVRNAFEATSAEQGSVTVTLTGKPNGVEIAVADCGTGIDPAVLPQLFTFGVSTKGEKGNGMGLWAVKHILTRHGGDIRVASTPGQGTTFTLWWPRAYNAGNKEQEAEVFAGTS